MTTDTDTPPEVAQADAEAREADELLATLEERVRDGDDKITPQQLTEQRELGRFARLRAEAARRKADRAAADAENKRRQKLTNDALALVEQQGDRAPVADAYERARAAIADLLAAADAHDQAVTEAARMLRQAGHGPMHRYEPVEQEGGHVISESRRAPASRTAPTVDPTADALAFGDDSRTRIRAERLLAVLVTDVATAHPVTVEPGQPAFDRAPITEQAHRHRDTVRAFLTAAKGGEAK
ncbi:hypothetical protein ACFYY3_33160 [Streptomyces sp. NPDC001812]|uniref:hypothetical protein n=1 Tax=Streptomyces sp. NPDC001812 TaxID=3364611 RepID=UPI0036BB23A5